jgi:uncharacterized membrane protein YtjA (UPF0391 family)
MLGLAILFAVLAIIFGIWGFATAAAVAWAGAKILFWIFLILFVLTLIAWPWGPGYRRGPPLPPV